jgi:predicted acyl esterase
LTEGLGLRREKPSARGGSTTYKFNPKNPVPTKGGLNLTLPLGPMDQREIGQRSDYLRFQTEPLAQDLVVAGKIDLELWAATDGLVPRQTTLTSIVTSDELLPYEEFVKRGVHHGICTIHYSPGRAETQGLVGEEFVWGHPPACPHRVVLGHRDDRA